MKERILREFRDRSDYFMKTDGAKEDYVRFALEKKQSYYSRLRGAGSFLRCIYRILTRLKVCIYRKKDKLILCNMLQNEAHRDIFIQAINAELTERAVDRKSENRE